MSDAALNGLKYLFLALLYVFLARVVQVVLRELRTPAVAAVATTPSATAGASRPRTRRGALRLRVVAPPSHQGAVYDVDDEMTVGRGGGCGLVLDDDQYASTLHARVFHRGADLWAEDLGSRNGTFLNETALRAPSRLRRGDRLRFGATVVEVVR